MDSVGPIIILYVVGAVLIAAELVIPSHGLLTIGSLVSFALAVYFTFDQNQTVGTVAAFGCVLFVPTMLFLGLKYVTRLPMGNHIAPPNPTRDEVALSFRQDEYRRFVGVSGKSLGPLRPSGVCEFDGCRIQCVAESGMIDAGKCVRGVDFQMGALKVRLDDSPST